MTETKKPRLSAGYFFCVKLNLYLLTFSIARCALHSGAELPGETDMGCTPFVAPFPKRRPHSCHARLFAVSLRGLGLLERPTLVACRLSAAQTSRRQKLSRPFHSQGWTVTLFVSPHQVFDAARCLLLSDGRGLP